jgi:TatD DNase family protein
MPGISYFDTHCHLQDQRYSGTIGDVLDRAQRAGVKGFLCCGTCGGREWQTVAHLAESWPAVVPAFGLHPWFVSDRTPDWLDILEKRLVENPASCCGEIGIDHACEESTFETQESVFVEQLKLAATLGRPVSVHCRRAFGRLLELVKGIGGIRNGGVIHSYSGPPDLIRPLIELGFSISFSGSLTFPGSKRARAAAAVVPGERLLVETDSPDIKPYLCEMELNEPSNVVRVAQALAEIREISVEEVAAATWENASRLFLK